MTSSGCRTREHQNLWSNPYLFPLSQLYSLDGGRVVAIEVAAGIKLSRFAPSRSSKLLERESYIISHLWGTGIPLSEILKTRFPPKREHGHPPAIPPWQREERDAGKGLS